MILTGSCSGASERTEMFWNVFVSAKVTMVLVKAQSVFQPVFEWPSGAAAWILFILVS